MGDPKNGWFIREIPLKWMIWGYPYFRKPPYMAWVNCEQNELPPKKRKCGTMSIAAAG